MHYAIWRTCERLGILPPNVKRRWDDNDPWVQAQLLAYSQVRDHEDIEIIEATGQAAGL